LLFFPTPSHANLTEDITTKFTTIPMAVAGVRTVKGVDQWFDAATQVCTSFSHCRSWANSNRVMWRAVPAAISIWYYADDDCKGKIVYTTNPSLASGTAILTSNPTGVAIKSLMAVGHSMYPLKGVISECYYSLNAVVEKCSMDPRRRMLHPRKSRHHFTDQRSSQSGTCRRTGMNRCPARPTDRVLCSLPKTHGS